MKKRFILFILLPAIALATNTSSFYKRAYALQHHHGKTFLRHNQRKIYPYRNNRIFINRQISRRAASPIYHRKSRVNTSIADSRRFFYANRAARRGNAKAQFDLAIMYATGRGVQKNERIAFNWFHKSARNNYAPAKHYMGLSFLQGRGVRKQKDLARYWFRLAAKQGYRASAIYLSKIDANRV